MDLEGNINFLISLNYYKDGEEIFIWGTQKGENCPAALNGEGWWTLFSGFSTYSDDIVATDLTAPTTTTTTTTTTTLSPCELSDESLKAVSFCSPSSFGVNIHSCVFEELNMAPEDVFFAGADGLSTLADGATANNTCQGVLRTSFGHF